MSCDNHYDKDLNKTGNMERYGNMEANYDRGRYNKFYFVRCMFVLYAIASIFGCGSPENANSASPTASSSQSNSPPSTAFDPIPPEVPIRRAYTRYQSPPSGFTSAIGWMQTIHDIRRTGTSQVEVDWMRLYARVNGIDYMIAEDNFNSGIVWGGLYQRSPWFATNNSTSLPAQFDAQNGYLYLHVSDVTDRVWHWWGAQWPRASIPSGVTNIWFEARIRIHGPALVQIGIDLWRSPSALYENGQNNLEAAASDWKFESDGGWQTIVAGTKP